MGLGVAWSSPINQWAKVIHYHSIMLRLPDHLRRFSQNERDLVHFPNNEETSVEGNTYSVPIKNIYAV